MGRVADAGSSTDENFDSYSDEESSGKHTPRKGGDAGAGAGAGRAGSKRPGSNNSKARTPGEMGGGSDALAPARRHARSRSRGKVDPQSGGRGNRDSSKGGRNAGSQRDRDTSKSSQRDRGSRKREDSASANASANASSPEGKSSSKNKGEAILSPLQQLMLGQDDTKQKQRAYKKERAEKRAAEKAAEQERIRKHKQGLKAIQGRRPVFAKAAGDEGECACPLYSGF